VMLTHDRERWGMSVGEARLRFGITRRKYIALEDGTAVPASDTYGRICEFLTRCRARSGSPTSLRDRARVRLSRVHPPSSTPVDMMVAVTCLVGAPRRALLS
jgi:hypothetical protein